MHEASLTDQDLLAVAPLVLAYLAIDYGIAGAHIATGSVVPIINDFRQGYYPWMPWQILDEAQELFFVGLPRKYPDVCLEYTRYPSGHIRATACGRDWTMSEAGDADNLPHMLLRVAVRAARYLRQRDEERIAAKEL